MMVAFRQIALTVFAGLACLVAPGVALAQLDAQPMRFTLVTNDVECLQCRYIRANGDIEDFTAAQFRQFVELYDLAGQPLTVMLHSPGGDVVAGLRLGREFREQGFNTQVGNSQRLPEGGYRLRPGDCASACTFAFLGGLSRYAEDDVIGIHRFYPGNLEPDERVILRPGDEAVAAMIKVYAVDMGVDDEFIEMSLTVPPADMRYMSNRELRELAVVNVEGPIALEQAQLVLTRKGHALHE